MCRLCVACLSSLGNLLRCVIMFANYTHNPPNKKYLKKVVGGGCCVVIFRVTFLCVSMSLGVDVGLCHICCFICRSFMCRCVSLIVSLVFYVVVLLGVANIITKRHTTTPNDTSYISYISDDNLKETLKKP